MLLRCWNNAGKDCRKEAEHNDKKIRSQRLLHLGHHRQVSNHYLDRSGSFHADKVCEMLNEHEAMKQFFKAVAEAIKGDK